MAIEKRDVPLHHSGLCFLVIDDSFHLRTIMHRFLEKQGFSVDVAENGKMGIDNYFENPDKFDAIFMDIDMPIMTGIEAAEKIRGSIAQNAQTIPIVAITGETQIDGTLFNHSLKKPFEMSELMRLLAILFDKGEGQNVL